MYCGAVYRVDGYISGVITLARVSNATCPKVNVIDHFRPFKFLFKTFFCQQYYLNFVMEEYDFTIIE